MWVWQACAVEYKLMLVRHTATIGMIALLHCWRMYARGSLLHVRIYMKRHTMNLDVVNFILVGM